MTDEVAKVNRGCLFTNVRTVGPFIDGMEADLPLLDQIEVLYSQVRIGVEEATSRRHSENPNPVKEEIAIGAFFEQIEPQVVDAVRQLNAKGYQTASSGFYGGGYQCIDGQMDLTDAEIECLLRSGANVKTHENGYAYIFFIPDAADLNVITQRWNLIASELPDRGYASVPSHTVGHEEFWRKYCDELTVKIIIKERILATGKEDTLHEEILRESLEELIARQKASSSIK